jgi:hypothetical protein
MKMFKSDQIRQTEISKVQIVLQALADGATISWVELEQQSGIKMHPSDAPGRNYARCAMHRLKRPYETLRGVGLRMSAPTNAITIAHGKFARIDGALRVADKTNHHLTTRHLEKMAPEEQRKLIIMGGFFGAVRAMASEHRKEIKR